MLEMKRKNTDGKGISLGALKSKHKKRDRRTSALGSGQVLGLQLEELHKRDALKNDSFDRGSGNFSGRKEKEEKNCYLCNGDLLYIVITQDKPEKTLALFVRELRNDYYSGCEYIKVLKVSQHFVEPCACRDLPAVHAYCMTAKIIRSQHINCDRCRQYYRLYIKQEKICTGKFVQTLTRYACLFFLIIFFAAFFLVLNSYLQSSNSKSSGESSLSPYTGVVNATNSTSLPPYNRLLEDLFNASDTNFSEPQEPAPPYDESPPANDTKEDNQINN